MRRRIFILTDVNSSDIELFSWQEDVLIDLEVKYGGVRRAVCALRSGLPVRLLLEYLGSDLSLFIRDGKGNFLANDSVNRAVSSLRDLEESVRSRMSVKDIISRMADVLLGHTSQPRPVDPCFIRNCDNSPLVTARLFNSMFTTRLGNTYNSQERNQ